MSDSPSRLPDDLDRPCESADLRPGEDLTVACYTFPHFHRSAFNDKLYGPGWTEYTVMRGCRPWFAGHHQPRTPLLGELDERDPATWHRYNELASASGIDAFIWDWYWYDDGPVLHEALEQGFLQSDNRDQLRFAVMWTNHPWPIVFPAQQTDGSNVLEIVAAAPDSPQVIRQSMSYIICRYFHLPNYWRIDEQPVLVVWDVGRLIRLFEIDGTRALLEELRSFARRLGHRGIHFHATGQSRTVFDQLEACGFDSYGRYNPIPEAATRVPYAANAWPDYGEAAAEVVGGIWAENDAASALPFFPGVSPGWDTAPRRCPPPSPPPGIVDGDEIWPTIVTGETPQAFGALVRAAAAFINTRRTTPAVLTIGCWNEWTEGQYLLPDTQFGYGMLRALAEALGKQTITAAMSAGELVG